jgi:2,3-bisphosphoglycerate-dependent phosphoglycerate mutase
MELGQEYVPVYKHWRLNERSYGALVGSNKKEMSKLHGPEQLKQWRRGYDTPPPPMDEQHEFHPRKLKRYREIKDIIPDCESLKDTVGRSSVYWDTVVAPSLKAGKTVLIVGHENNLRSLIMRLEGIKPSDIINLSLPRAVPLCYTVDSSLQPVNEREDGGKDKATGFLTGKWLGGDEAVGETLERDNKNVYDVKVEENLELEGGKERGEKWRKWKEERMEGE